MTRAFVFEQDVRYNMDELPDVEYVFDDFRPSVFATDQLMEAVKEALARKNFDPEKDTLVLAGKLTGTATAVVAMLQEYRTIRVLIYDMRERVFVPRIFGVDHEARSEQAVLDRKREF